MHKYQTYIGKRTSIGRFSKVESAYIGRYCSISWDVTIGATSHPIERISGHAFSYRKQFGLVNENIYFEKEKVYIGNDVWIGCGAIILPGVVIGNGAVIGAGAVVTKNVKPYSIVVGVPAKHIKFRFREDVCETLNKTNWWLLPDDVIKENLDLFLADLDEEKLTKLVMLCKLYKLYEEF